MNQHRVSSDPERLTNNRHSVVRLIRDLKRRRYREENQSFRIEGYREIERALDAKVECEIVIYCDSIPRFRQCESTFNRLRALSKVKLFAASSSVFASLSQWQNPDGLLVVAKQQDRSLANIEVNVNDVFLVIDGVEKPGNLGSMFRTVDATGCTGILISDPIVDLYNPNVIRASLGTVFTTPCAVADSAQVIQWLHENQFRIVCSSPQGSHSFLDIPLDFGCAIVIGSEKDGLGRAWFDASDNVVRLPSEGFADSLNAAMTANAILFESHRQRQLKNNMR